MGFWRTTCVRVDRLLFGHDVFFAYSRSDVRYVTGLAQELAREDFDCFHDSLVSIAGHTTPREVVRGLKRSSLLVVVGTPTAAASRNVLVEIRFFRRLRRTICPISLGGGLETGGLRKALPGLVPERELAGAEWPSEHVVRYVIGSARFLRRSKRIRRLTAWTSLAFLVILGAGLIAAKLLASEIDQLLVERRLAAADHAVDLAASAEDLFSTQPLAALDFAIRATEVEREHGLEPSTESVGALLRTSTRVSGRPLEHKASLPGHRRIDPEGRFIVTVDKGGKVVAKSLLQTDPIETLLMDIPADDGDLLSAVWMAFTPNGESFLIACAPSENTFHSGSWRLDPEGKRFERLGEIAVPEDPFVGMHPDGAWTVHLIDDETWEHREVGGPGRFQTSAELRWRGFWFSPVGDEVAVIGDDQLLLQPLAAGLTPPAILDLSADTGSVLDVAFARSKSVATVSSDGAVVLWSREGEDGGIRRRELENVFELHGEWLHVSGQPFRPHELEASLEFDAAETTLLVRVIEARGSPEARIGLAAWYPLESNSPDQPMPLVHRKLELFGAFTPQTIVTSVPGERSELVVQDPIALGIRDAFFLGEAGLLTWGLDGSLRWRPDARGARDVPLARRVSALTLGDDGDWLAVGTEEGSVLLWYLPWFARNEPGDLIATLEGLSAPVDKLIISSSAQRLVAVDRDGNARVWDLSSPMLAHLLLTSGSLDLVVTRSPSNDGSIFDLSLFPQHPASSWTSPVLADALYAQDGDMLVTLEEVGESSDGLTLKTWNLRLQAPFELPIRNALVEEPRARELLKPGTTLIATPGERAWIVRLAGSGLWLGDLGASSEDAVRFELLIGPAEDLEPPQVSRTGRWLAVVPYESHVEERKAAIHLWDLDHEDPSSKHAFLALEPLDAGDVEFSSTGDRMLTRSREGEARLWRPDVITRGEHDEPLELGRAEAFAFHPMLAELYYSDPEGGVARFDLTSNRQEASGHGGSLGPQRLLRFDAEGKHLAGVGRDGSAWIAPICTSNGLGAVGSLPPLDESFAIATLAVAPGGLRVAAFGEDGRIALWTTGANHKFRPPLVVTSDKGSRFDTIDFTADGRWLVRRTGRFRASLMAMDEDLRLELARAARGSPLQR